MASFRKASIDPSALMSSLVEPFGGHPSHVKRITLEMIGSLADSLATVPGSVGFS